MLKQEQLKQILAALTYLRFNISAAEADRYTDDKYLVRAKWSKILSGRKRNYSRCYGTPFIMQFSGSGLVAPCGMLFNDKYNEYHIGNIVDTSFKKIWQSDRYWEVVNLIVSEKFDARTMCGSLCLQHKVNECLWALKHKNAILVKEDADPPMHINFI